MAGRLSLSPRTFLIPPLLRAPQRANRMQSRSLCSSSSRLTQLSRLSSTQRDRVSTSVSHEQTKKKQEEQEDQRKRKRKREEKTVRSFWGVCLEYEGDGVKIREGGKKRRRRRSQRKKTERRDDRDKRRRHVIQRRNFHKKSPMTAILATPRHHTCTEPYIDIDIYIYIYLGIHRHLYIFIARHPHRRFSIPSFQDMGSHTQHRHVCLDRQRHI